MHRSIVSSSDDLGCWALEAKSIYYYGGFAPKYQNAAVSYGNYFPGTTLFRWWICHFSPSFQEGLLAVGSAWLFILLLAPILSDFQFGLAFAPAAAVLGGGLLLLLPGACDLMTYLSISAEPLIAAAYAGAWITLFSPRPRSGKINLAAYTLLMTLFKATGILYAASVFLFLCLLWKRPQYMEPGTTLSVLRPGAAFRKALCICVPALVWVIYCAVMGRSSYFTFSAGADPGAADGVLTGYVLPYLRSFLASLVFVPAHYTHDGILDLPLLCILLIILTYGFAAVRLGCLTPQSGRLLGRAYAGIFAVFVAAFLLMHCFVFRETQYFEPENMVMACSRYAQPLFLGALLFLFQRFASGRKKRGKKIAIASFFLFAFSCTCLWTVYYRVVNNTALVEQTLAVRQNVTAKNEAFLSARNNVPGGRFLYVHGEEFELSYPDGNCLQFLCAPDSIVIFSPDAQADGPSVAASLAQLMEDAHPDWLFLIGFDPDTLAAAAPFGPLEQNTLLSIDRICADSGILSK